MLGGIDADTQLLAAVLSALAIAVGGGAALLKVLVGNLLLTTREHGKQLAEQTLLLQDIRTALEQRNRRRDQAP